jgi:hypothetical protein
MKKLITAFAVAAMTTVGLVGVAPQANAACDASYNKCEDTKPKVQEPKVKKNGRVKIKLDVKNKGAKPTSVPKGTANFVCAGPQGATKSFSEDVNGSISTTKKFEPAGAWTCSVAFEPKNPKKFGPSSTSFSFNNKG